MIIRYYMIICYYMFVCYYVFNMFVCYYVFNMFLCLYGSLGYFLKSGLRFSRKALPPSWASSRK